MGIVVREIADGLDDEPLLLLERFHGHLGPYVVLGYRMGRFARKFLGKNPFGLRAEVFTGSTPPISCLVDGIQVGSGCTLGKGNVSIKEGGIAQVHFITDDGRRLGRIVNIIATGGADVLEVEGPPGGLMIPASEESIVRLDLEKKRLTVRLIEGLLNEGSE